MSTAKRWTLLGVSALFASMPAMAQEAAAPAAGDDATAKIEFLEAQVEAMQAQLEELKKASKANTPAYKPSPEFKSDGFSFRVKGRAQFDAGYVENPNDAVATKNLGFNSRSRRLIIGAEGEMPGGFKYKSEFNFASGSVGYEDIILQYAPSGADWNVTVGNFYPYSSLEIMTSSGATNFLERAQMNEAFGHERRLGIGLGYAMGDFRINAGLFNDAINNAFDNDDWLFGARATYSPQALGGMLHLGANYQHREFQSNALNFQYRQRPFVQTTDIRFADTGSLAADGDDVYGVEVAGIFGPLHVASEAQWTKVRAITPAETLTGLDSVAGATRFADDAGFFSAYGEVGYWLTGETRGYKNGAWDRTKVLNGFDKGGWGAFGVNARYDYLDLRDRVAAGTTAANSFTAPNFINGGKQTGYLLSLIWQPIDYVRVTAQYTRADIEGGPRAGVVVPTSTDIAADRDYNVDILAMRFQFDF